MKLGVYGLCGVCDAELDSEFTCPVCPVDVPSAPWIGIQLPLPPEAEVDVCQRCRSVVDSEGKCKCGRGAASDSLLRAIKNINCAIEAMLEERLQK